MIKRRGKSGVLVTFELPASVLAARASVCGEFNDWSPLAHPMARTSSGQLEAVIDLEAGRAWRFRYLLDDQRWENDWTADAYVPNEFGAEDSVVDLVGPEAKPSGPAEAAPVTEAPAEARDPSAEATAEPAAKKADRPSPGAAGMKNAATTAAAAKQAAAKTATAAAKQAAAKTTTAAAKKAATKTTTAAARKAATTPTPAPTPTPIPAAKKTAAKKSATSAAATKEPTNKSDAPIKKSAAKKTVSR